MPDHNQRCNSNVFGVYYRAEYVDGFASMVIQYILLLDISGAIRTSIISGSASIFVFLGVAALVLIGVIKYNRLR